MAEGYAQTEDQEAGKMRAQMYKAQIKETQPGAAAPINSNSIVENIKDAIIGN